MEESFHEVTVFFFFQAEDGIRDLTVTGVQTCALPIWAPCVGYQSEADYRRMIDDVLLFLEGKTVDVRTRLRERMHEASQRLDYERAAQLRDALKWLDQLEQPQTVELVGGGDADAIGLARDGDDACGVVLRVRDGRLIARDHRFLENVEDRKSVV